MHKNSLLKEFFNYSRSELRGLTVLGIILVLLVLLRWQMHEPIHNFNLTRVSALHNSIRNDTVRSKHTKAFNQADKYRKKTPAGFINPNTASISQLLETGLSASVVSEIKKYRSKGGYFKTGADLLCIDGVDAVVLAKIQPYLYDTFYYNAPLASAYRNQPKVDLNKADTAGLVILPGIGPVLAVRILKYRNLLGGYYSTQQLTEVYGISDSLVATLQNRIYVDSTDIRKVSINSSSFSTLIQHPYLNRYQVKAIQSYLKHMGNFTTPKQLVDNYLVTNDVYLKLLPYLQL